MRGEMRPAKNFLAFLICAGLLNALIAAFVVCRLPESHTPSLVSIFFRALIYVGVGAMAGVAGAWFYWKRSSHPSKRSFPISFGLFALTCAAGWVWVPAVAILSDQDSAGAAIFSVVGAWLLAAGLRGVIPTINADADPSEMERRPMFADTLRAEPLRPDGYVVALGIYAAGYALRDHSALTASGLIALGAFVFAWNWIVPRGRQGNTEGNRRAVLRLARVAVPAVLITAWALLGGVAHRNRASGDGTALARGDSGEGGDAKRKADGQASPYGLGGYQSLVLWPFPPRKQIVPPIPVRSSLFAPGTTQPLVIRFDGVYWYFQPPRKDPGADAHQARGTPVAVNIHSNNFIPIVMQAHQHLGGAVPIRRCREIQVEIENRDNTPGTIALALLLRDSSAPAEASLYLGQQTLVSSQPGHFRIKSSPVFETLRFAVPARGGVRQFDTIHVMVLPDVEHSTISPKIGIEQFQLFPR